MNQLFFIALPEFAGLSAFGITEDAALKELKIAEKGFLEVIIEDKGEVK